MNAFLGKIIKLSTDALNAFKKFPAAMLSALAFAVVTIIRINLDWPQQEPYNFLFNCLHLSLALGAIFSLAAITAAQTLYSKRKAFLLANLLGILAAVVTFLALYYFGGTDPVSTGYRYRVVSRLAAARVSAAMLVSFLLFVMLAGYPKDQSDFARSSFMTLKAFFVALIYGGTIMAGLSGVAGAVQALLYNAMSEKVYMYIGTLSGFLAFAIFVGYFPDFRRGVVDPRRQEAQQQPRFVAVLFSSIMVPIMTALTVVLLIWTVKSLVTGVAVPFSRLSSIATSYAIGGIWLHIMVTHHESNLAQFYRRFYPYAALVILAFEARALWIQLSASGLKTAEYWFIIIWILAVAGAVWLIVKKDKAHQPIVVLACVLAIFSVFPVIGYHALPVAFQVNRLQNLLVSQGMLKDGKLVPAATEPELSVRESITDAVVFLAASQDVELPSWFDRDLAYNETFKAKLGFEQTWPKPETPDIGGDYMATILHRPAGAVDISAYRWAVSSQENYGIEQNPVTINGDRGSYRIYWNIDPAYGIPTLRITLNDKEILNEDMNSYIDRIAGKYPPGRGVQPQVGNAEDMILKLETPEVKVLLVFNDIEISVDPRDDIIRHSLNLDALYLQEKPSLQQ